MPKLQFSLLSIVLLALLFSASVGVYVKSDAWAVVLHIDENLNPCSLAITPDGTRLALGVEYGVELWDVLGRCRIANVPENRAFHVASMSFTSDYQNILYVAMDVENDVSEPRVVVRDALTLSQRQSISDAFTATLSADQSLLFTSRNRRGRLIDFPNGKKERTLEFDRGPLPYGITDGIFLHDGKRLFTFCRYEKNIDLWDAATGSHIKSIRVDDGVRAAAPIPDSSIVALATYTGLSFLSLETGKETWHEKLPPSDYATVAFCADSSRFAVSKFDELIVYTWPTLEEVTRLSCPGASKYCDIAMSRDGTTVAISSYDVGETWVLQRQRPEGPLGLLALPQSWIALFSAAALLRKLTLSTMGGTARQH